MLKSKLVHWTNYWYAMRQKFPLFPLRIPHKGKNKGKYISFHYLMGWKACKIRKVQEISPQIPICKFLLLIISHTHIYTLAKDLLHIHHLHNIEKRSPRRFSPGRRPHRFLQRDHCICSLFRNGNGFSVSIPTTGTGLRSLFRPYIHLLYFNYAR